MSRCVDVGDLQPGVPENSPAALTAMTRIAVVELVPRPAQRWELLGPYVDLVRVEVLGVTTTAIARRLGHLLGEAAPRRAVSLDALATPLHIAPGGDGGGGCARRRPRVGRRAAAGRVALIAGAGWRLRALIGCPPAVVSGLPRRSRVTRSRGLWISGMSDSPCKGHLQVPLRGTCSEASASPATPLSTARPLSARSAPQRTREPADAP